MPFEKQLPPGYSDPLFSDVALYVGRFTTKELVTDYDAINQNIFLILTTPIRAKWWRPRLGSNIPAYLFQPMDDTTAGQIRTEILTLLARNMEYRVVINSVLVVPNYDTQLYAVEITYTAVDISGERNKFQFSLNKQT